MGLGTRFKRLDKLYLFGYGNLRRRVHSPFAKPFGRHRVTGVEI